MKMNSTQIEQTLHETSWNISESAKRLGLTRTQMYGRLNKYRLERPTLDGSA